jgi:hypothetical protein
MLFTKLLLGLFLLILAQFFLPAICGTAQAQIHPAAGAERNNKKFPICVLDRKPIIDALPSNEKSAPAILDNSSENIYVLLDNSYSMSGFLAPNNLGLYEAALEAGGKIFQNSTAFWGYKMSDLLSQTMSDSHEDAKRGTEPQNAAAESSAEAESGGASPEANVTKLESSSLAFFAKAADKSSYDESTFSYFPSAPRLVRKATDEGRIPQAVEMMLDRSDKSSNQLFVLFTDLRVTDESGLNPEILLLLKPLNPFVKSKASNIGIIGIQSRHYNGLPNSPEVKDGQLINLSKYIRPEALSGTSRAECPFYIILFGSSALVDKYMNAFLFELPSDQSKIKSLLLDPFPKSFEKPPEAQDVYSNPPVPELSDKFRKYTLELPQSATAFNYVFSDQLFGKTDGQKYSDLELRWDKYITDEKVPFWRLWDKYATEDFADFELVFEADSNVAMPRENIVIHYFACDPKTNSTISGNNTDNSFLYVGNPSYNDNKLHVPLELLQSKLHINSPVLFVFDAPLKKEMRAAPYTKTDYENISWYKDWTLNLNDYFDNAYRWIAPANGKPGQWAFWMDGSYYPLGDKNGRHYRSSEKTLNLDILVKALYQERQQFIINENKSGTNSDVHQYAVFGFVKRRLYSLEWIDDGNKGRPDDPNFNSQNGGYAISIDESRKLIPAGS